MALSDAEYARLLDLRTGLRRFQRWSEQQARRAGLRPAQHQLLLAVRGHDDPRGPTIGEVADYLFLQHHSAVELVDRADKAGLVERRRSSDDHRIVRLELTSLGAERLEALSALHVEELERLANRLPAAWRGLAPTRRSHGFPDGPQQKGARVSVSIGRVYDAVQPRRGEVVLVDRLWPRGLARRNAPFTTWMKDVAPSPNLRKWFGHVPARFPQFRERYRKELSRGRALTALEELRTMAGTSEVTLLTATRDLEHSGAAVLRDVLASV